MNRSALRRIKADVRFSRTELHMYDRPGPFLNHGIEGLLPGEITRKAKLSAPERHA